jgi:lysyl-tRNA synthetase class 2
VSDIEQAIDANEQIVQRKAKLAAWRESHQAYPNDVSRDHLAGDMHAEYDALDKDSLTAANIIVAVAGRMMTRRVMGKASFLNLQDMSGTIQIYIALDELSEELYEEFKKWDLGDIIAVTGALFKTKTDELSVRASSIKLMTKSLRPLPDKFHGLQDQEARFRQRYLDLMVNEESRAVFKTRVAIIKALRNFFDAAGFMEVETPMMHPLIGGAAARPFVTHHNTLDMQLFLRIAPELYLKRLVVGGFEKVYEINRNFRNEGLSTRHNPEFTMIEFYQAFCDYHYLMNFSEKLFRHLCETVLGTTQVTYNGNVIDFAKPFKRITIRDSILAASEITPQQLDNFAMAKQIAESMGLHIPDYAGLGKIHMELFEHLVEPSLMQPTFVTEFPAEVSPLARANDANPFVTDRFELYIGGQEIANGFSELNDPEDQARRFQAQLDAGLAGDVEAMSFDEDYITALEYGLPPTAGEGIGIDRLVMLLTDTPTIRDVILFPQLRNKTE